MPKATDYTRASCSVCKRDVAAYTPVGESKLVYRGHATHNYRGAASCPNSKKAVPAGSERTA